jgi:DNA anti-recombination protein RmuC
MADVVQLMDSLGKVLETATPNIEAALKQLAGAMTAAVTKINDAMTGGKTDEFFNLITDKGDKIKKFAEYLQTDMPKAFKGLAGDIDDVRNGLEKTAQILEDIRKNAKGGGAGGGGGGGRRRSSSTIKCIGFTNADS